MTDDAALHVHFDGAAFMQHRRSGISRYFAELVAAFDADPALGVEPVTPYRWMTNVHARGGTRRFRSLPLPRRGRASVLARLNRRYAARGAAADIHHYPFYDASRLEVAHEQVSVTTVHDFTFEVLPGVFGDLGAELGLKRRFLEACDVLVCVSEATAHDLHRFHPDLDKPVLVTPLGVSEEFFASPGSPVKGVPERYLLHVGNRAEHKNIDLLLRAFAKLAAEDPTLYLVMSGAGLPDESAKLAELGVADRTRLLKVSDADLPALYSGAQAFVFPSRYEGFGLPLLEAMAAGAPAVITDIPASLEVAGDTAEVVGCDDVDGTVAAIQRLIGDRDLAATRRRAGRARAREFSWHRTAELTAAAYDRAVRPGL